MAENVWKGKRRKRTRVVSHWHFDFCTAFAISGSLLLRSQNVFFLGSPRKIERGGDLCRRFLSQHQNELEDGRGSERSRGCGFTPEASCTASVPPKACGANRQAEAICVQNQSNKMKSVGAARFCCPAQISGPCTQITPRHLACVWTQ